MASKANREKRVFFCGDFDSPGMQRVAHLAAAMARRAQEADVDPEERQCLRDLVDEIRETFADRIRG